MLRSYHDLKRKWSAAVFWLNEELYQVSCGFFIFCNVQFKASLFFNVLLCVYHSILSAVDLVFIDFMIFIFQLLYLFLLMNLKSVFMQNLRFLDLTPCTKNCCIK